MELQHDIFTLNELGNAQRLEAEFLGRFLWTKPTDWMVYSRGKWSRDVQKHSVRAMIHVIETLETSDNEDILKWALKSGCHKVINGALTLASSLSQFSRHIGAFDQHPELFNVGNGTYNFDSGVFQAHDPADMLTKQSPIKYDPDATCPKFEKFLSEVMDGKETMRLFLQRACGYTMSAHTTEPALMFTFGRSGTGKTQFLNVMRGILGTYAATADSEMFLAKRGDAGQPFELAGMDGVRALMASELEENKRLATAKVKRLTGGDPVAACYKGKEAYSFMPQWKIWLAANDKPTVAAMDDAIWDRLKLIPFDVKFRGTQQQVMDIGALLLKEEGQGILNWFIQGYHMWREQGLNYPVEVQEAVAEWQSEEDYLARFLTEQTIPCEDKNQFVTRVALYNSFTRWADSSKEGRGVNSKHFGIQMRRKGYDEKVIKQGGKPVRVWMGLKALDPLANFGSGVSMEDFEDIDPGDKKRVN